MFLSTKYLGTYFILSNCDFCVQYCHQQQQNNFRFTFYEHRFTFYSCIVGYKFITSFNALRQRWIAGITDHIKMFTLRCFQRTTLSSCSLPSHTSLLTTQVTTNTVAFIDQIRVRTTMLTSIGTAHFIMQVVVYRFIRM